MEVSILESFKIIWRKVLDFIDRMAVNMLVIGIKTNRIGWEKKSGMMAVITRASINKVRKMDKENTNGRTAISTLETGKTMTSMGKVSSYSTTKDYSLVNGKTTRCTEPVLISGLMVAYLLAAIKKT